MNGIEAARLTVTHSCIKGRSRQCKVATNHQVSNKIHPYLISQIGFPTSSSSNISREYFIYFTTKLECDISKRCLIFNASEKQEKEKVFHFFGINEYQDKKTQCSSVVRFLGGRDLLNIQRL